MNNYSRKEVVMKSLSNYVKDNIEMSLNDFLKGYLTDMIYVHSYYVGPHWRKRREK